MKKLILKGFIFYIVGTVVVYYLIKWIDNMP